MSEEYKVLFRLGLFEFDNHRHICHKEGSENKFSLAYFEKTKEGYDLKFAGGNSFEYSWEVLKAFEEMVK